MDFLIELFADTENQVIALLAFLSTSFSGVIVYQWRHTQKKTVPKWAWNDLVKKVEKMMEKQNSEFSKITEILRHLD